MISELFNKTNIDSLIRSTKNLTLAEAAHKLSIKGVAAEEAKAALIRQGYEKETVEATMANYEYAKSNTAVSGSLGQQTVQAFSNAVAKFQDVWTTYSLTMDNAGVFTKLKSASGEFFATLSSGIPLVGKIGIAIAGLALILGGLKAAYDATIQTEEELAEATENLMSKYKELRSEAESNKETVEEIGARYEELSKGVNALGENISLSTEEFKDYRNICNKIADMFPDMVRGWNEQGDAILDTTKKVGDLTEAYKENQKEAYHTLLYGTKASGDEENTGQKVLDYYQQLYGKADVLTILGESVFGNDADAGKGVTYNNALEVLKKSVQLSKEDFLDYYHSLGNSEQSSDDYNKFLYLLRNFDMSVEVTKDNEFKMTDEDFSLLREQMIAALSSLEQEADDRLSNVKEMVKAALYLDSGSEKLIENGMFDTVSIMINNIDHELAKTELATIPGITKWVGNLVTKLNSATPEVQKALINLFNIKTSDLGADEAYDYANSLIDTLTPILGKDIIDIVKQSMGYNEIENLADSYDTMVYQIAKKISGYDPFFNWSPEIIEKQHAFEQRIDEFAKQYSMNTQDEIAAFYDCFDEAKGDIEKAFELYLDKMKNKGKEDILGISGTIENLNTKLKPVIDSLTSAYQDIFSEDGFTLENVGVDMLNSVKEAIAEINDIDGIDIKKETFEDFVKVLTNTESTSDDVHNAFDTLVTDIILATDTAEISAENYDVLVQSLKEMGITNAEETLGEIKRVQDLLIAQGDDLRYMTTEQIVEFYNEAEASGVAAQYLKKYALQKALADNPLKTDEDVQELENLINALGLTSELAPQLAVIKNAVNMINLKETTGLGAPVEASMSQIKSAIQKIQEYIDEEFEFGLDFKFNGDGSGNDEDKEALKEKFDWIETFISRLQSEIDKLGEAIDRAFTPFDIRKSKIGDKIGLLNKELADQATAKNEYWTEAKNVGLDKGIAELIREGKLTDGIKSGYKVETQEKIEEYQKWYEKYLEAERRIAEIPAEIVAEYQAKFDMISSEYDAQLGVIEHKANMINGMIDQAEASGHMVSRKYYDNLIALETQTQADLLAKKGELEAALAEAMANGVAEGSETWYDLTGQILEVDEAIQESTNSVIEFNNQIRELEWTQFDKIQDLISEIHDEKDFFIELMSNEDLFDDNGNWTEYADATAGLHAMGYNTYLAQAEAYAKEIADLDTKFAGDTSNDYYIERRKELLEAQRENILAAEDEKQAMIDLAREGYDAMLESLDELIEKRKEALDSERDLYEYQKKIADQTKNIASIEKQLMAYEGDDSEETQAKVQQLKVSLEEAKDELEQSEYDRWRQDQEQILDKFRDDAQDWVDQRLENQDELIRDILAAVDGDTNSIKNTLDGLANEVGISMSSSMTGIFGEGSVFEKVNTTLTSIESYVATLVGEADAKAGNNSNNVGGGANASGNNAGGNNQSSNSGSNTDGSQDSEDKKWGSWFTKKKYSYSKSQLEKNKDTSVIDRLAWLGYDNSFDARAKYYSAMGGSGTYTGSAKQNKWMIAEMKKHKGYATGSRRIKNNELAWTQENGQELIYRSKDGAMLTPLGTGDAVFTSEMTQRLWDIAKTPEIFSTLTSTALPRGFVSNGTNNSVQNDVVMNISLPNVVDVDGFVNELRTNKRFEKVVQSMTIGAISSKGNSYNKLKY